MAKRKHLRKRQLAVINDLFGGELEEQAVLEKHKVSRHVYNKWLADEGFSAEFARRIACARFQSEALIAKYSLLAAAKLVQLTESENAETARKACLDIISLPNRATKDAKQGSRRQQSDDEHGQQLPQQTASRLLAALAEEKQLLRT